MNHRSKEAAPPPARPDGSLWPPDMAAKFWAVSRRHAERLIAAGSISAVRLGHRVMIPDQEVKRVAREGTESGTD